MVCRGSRPSMKPESAPVRGSVCVARKRGMNRGTICDGKKNNLQAIIPGRGLFPTKPTEYGCGQTGIIVKVEAPPKEVEARRSKVEEPSGKAVVAKRKGSIEDELPKATPRPRALPTPTGSTGSLAESVDLVEGPSTAALPPLVELGGGIDNVHSEEESEEEYENLSSITPDLRGDSRLSLTERGGTSRATVREVDSRLSEITTACTSECS